MDAVKFVEERRRMFDVTGEYPKYNLFSLNISAEDVVKEVEEWSAAHLRKTRQDVFIEQYPEADIGDDGVLRICPSLIAASYRLNNGKCVHASEHKFTHCSDCRREFWMQEVEEDK